MDLRRYFNAAPSGFREREATVETKRPGISSFLNAVKGLLPFIMRS